MSITSPGSQPPRIPAPPANESMPTPGMLSHPGYPMVPGMNGSHPQGMPHAAGNELWGAINRRKFVVILMAILGAGGGYLYFTKAPDVFQSSLKLQITSQAPPSIVNGDMVVQKVSAPRHQSLLASELVLSAAMNDNSGNLKNLKTFSTGEHPVGLLKDSLKVTSMTTTEDTLVLTLTGGHGDELPMILNNIVSAYTSILEEDNRAVGQESIALIEKLQQRMLSEKNVAEERYLKLIKEVGADSTVDGETLENPHAARLSELMLEQRRDETELQSILDRLAAVSRAIESNDQNQIKVVAIEALKFMGLEYEQKLESSIKSEVGIGTKANEWELRDAENRVNQISDRYFMLETERQRLGKVRGAGHPQLQQLDEQLEFLKSELTRAEAMREQFRIAGVGVQSEIEKAKADADNGPSWEEKKIAAERQWIGLYVTQMESDALRLNSAIERREVELSSVRASASKISGDVVELNILQKQIEEKRDAVRVILDRLSEINVLSSNYNMVKVRVLDTPGPGSKIAPSLPKSVGYGVLIASLLGAGLALLIDRADLAFRNPHEIFERLGAPVMGKIPRVRVAGKQSQGSPNLISAHQSNSSFTESFRGIRTALFYAAGREDIRSILCTSPSPGDGKSTTACNLALSMTQAGKRVLLVDADLRRPRVHQYFGEKIGPGLIDYLNGESSMEEIVRPMANENLFVITAGSRAKHPGEMVGHPKLAELLNEAREHYDFVIVDSPPVMPVADPCVLGSLVDGILMVVRIRKGVKVTSQKSRESLTRAGGKLVGVLVNGVDENPHYSEYGYYGAYYGHGYGYYGAGQKYDRYTDKVTGKKG